MKQYLKLLAKVLNTGIPSGDRTGTGTSRIFGEQLKFDLTKGFPLLTTKKMFYKGSIHELIWMLRGTAYINYLKENNVHIWDAWADEDGYIGPLYGCQWRRWAHDDECIDQLQQAINEIRKNPYSRRMVVSAWNVGQLPFMNLPPCHILFQFHADPVNLELSLSMYQRSADIFLGLPFDISLYAFLLSIVAQLTGYTAKNLIISLGDAHLYNNHKEQAKIQLSREPLRLSKLWLNPEIKNIDDFTFEDIKILNYDSHPAIKADISV